MVQPPILTDDEIDEICKPLTQSHAQINYMRSLGMIVKRKPSGRPLVAREEFRRVTVQHLHERPDRAEVQPNREALRNLFKGRQHGTQA